MMRLCRPDGAPRKIGESFQGLAPLATDLRPVGAGRMTGDLFQGLTRLVTNDRRFGASCAMSDWRPVLALLKQRTTCSEVEFL